MYADTDFFIALLSKKDRLRKSAETIYSKHKDELWTSTLTLRELMILAYRESKDPIRIIERAAELVEIRDPAIGIEGHLGACYLMRKYNMTPSDALHAIYCGSDMIVSSNKIYDLVGLKRLALD
ncbi:MAG: type II toxin-antitoxin system VapC family toxin [Candidatus Thermoplasmatota archaeon]|nr:type II toxin-antitoxin system VapC family toxin [Candidatus Thermoplasmatota archaeon]